VSVRGRWDVVLAIAVGGAIGAAARWGLTQAWPPTAGAFPWVTFTVNVSGCLVIGALMVYLLEVLRPGRYARPFLATGVLGGYTTFSTYAGETETLLRHGHAPAALAYLFGTLVAALLATWVGLALARLAAGHTHPGHGRTP
jgi:fluoride exporter